MIMKWANDDVKLVEKFIDIKNKGFYCNGGELTIVYNRVLEKNVPSTNCGSCIRNRINELETALNRFKQQINEIENKAVSSVTESKTDDESTVVSDVEAINEENKVEEPKPKKKIKK